MMRISGSYHSASSFPLFLLFSVRSVYSALSDDRYCVVNKNMRSHRQPPEEVCTQISGYDTRCVNSHVYAGDGCSVF